MRLGKSADSGRAAMPECLSTETRADALTAAWENASARRSDEHDFRAVTHIIAILIVNSELFFISLHAIMRNNKNNNEL